MAETTLQAGDWAPHFHATTNTSHHFSFGSLGGRYVILSFLGTLTNKASAAAYAHMVAKQPWLQGGRMGAYIAVLYDPADMRTLATAPPIPGIRAVFDSELAIGRLYGRVTEQDGVRRYSAITYVLDPMLRVLAALPIDDAGKHDAMLDKVLATLPPPEAHAGAPLAAPVLVLPRVFEPEFCRRLIELYESHGGVPSGFMREVGGMTTVQQDQNLKRRSDHVIADEALQGEIRWRIERRLVPGVRAAFDFTATRLERHLVACYDSKNGGFFKAHRDNTTKGTAHRRFAVTINLNAEDYEGGDLNFPEFGAKTYRAPTGGAVVFGCALLHEALPVTRGRRYAFLPFLFDEAGETLRLENLKFVAQDETVTNPSPEVNN